LRAAIRQNGARAITGTTLKAVLEDFIDSISFPGTIQIGDVEGLAAAIAAAGAGDIGEIEMSDVNGLEAALAALGGGGSLTIADIDGLQAALDAKAATAHTQAISTISGLQTALDGKAASSHVHTIANVTDLQTTLDGKASTSHTHTIANITNLQTTLDGKAATSHTQAISTITSLQTTLTALAAADTALGNADSALDTRLDAAEIAIDALEAAGGAGTVSELVNGANVRFKATATGAQLHAPTYANNAAALTGGLLVNEVYKTADGSLKHVLAQGGAGSTPPPAGSQLISTWDPVNDDNYYSATLGTGTSTPFWYKEKKWVSDLSFQPWCLSSPDDNILRFEVHPGDLFDIPGFYTDSAGVNRNKITEIGADWHTPTSDIHYRNFSFMVEGPPITSNFFALVEQHTYGPGVIAQKFELVIANERLKVTVNSDRVTDGSPQYYSPWTDNVPIVRGHWYQCSIFIRSNRASSAGIVIVDIDGVRKVNLTGVRTGYAAETYTSLEFGIYRGTSSPESIVVSYKDWNFGAGTWGAYGTLTPPAAPSGVIPPGETYGPDLLGGMNVTNYMAVDCLLTNPDSTTIQVQSATFPTADDPAARKELTLDTTKEYLLTGTGYWRVSTGAVANVLLYNESFGTAHVDLQNSTTTPVAVSERFTPDTALNYFYFMCDADSTADQCRFQGFTLREVIP
jgi:hypothetical protein